MAKLPNGERAVIPLEKLTEYSLNPEHPTGRHKARVFRAALGLTLKDADFLREEVHLAARTGEAVASTPTEYGERYVIDFVMTTDSGSATVRTSWMIRKDEDFPRLTSCYVLEE